MVSLCGRPGGQSMLGWEEGPAFVVLVSTVASSKPQQERFESQQKCCIEYHPAIDMLYPALRRLSARIYDPCSNASSIYEVCVLTSCMEASCADFSMYFPKSLQSLLMTLLPSAVPLYHVCITQLLNDLDHDSARLGNVTINVKTRSSVDV